MDWFLPQLNFDASRERFIETVAIFGSADQGPDSQEYQDAFNIASLLTKEGYGVVNGGGPGVMEAATKGAEAAGGETTTIAFMPTNAPNFEPATMANAPDGSITVPNYLERVGGLITASDAFVVMRGGTGTLSEWSMVWLLAHIYYGKHKPFILFGDFWHDFMASVQKHFLIDGVENQVYRIVSTVEEIAPALKDLDADLRRLNHV